MTSFEALVVPRFSLPTLSYILYSRIPISRNQWRGKHDISQRILCKLQNVIKCRKTELLHLIGDTWGSPTGWKCLVGSHRGSDEELCSKWELLPLIFFFFFNSKPKSGVWLLSAALGWTQQCIFQISISTLDLWHQPGSLNQWIWKPQRAWTSVSEGEVTSRSAV